MIRRPAVLVAIAALLTSCGIFGKDQVDLRPGLPDAFGARITDSELRIWTGSRCLGAERAVLAFEPSHSALILVPASGAGTDIEYLTVGPNPGWKIAEPLPPGFEWRNERKLYLTQIDAGSGVAADIETIVRDSAAHPADTYWFQGVGWLNAADVAAQDGKTFRSFCSPHPL
ncbi:hypothetical protein [Nocardia canadensis]|uniref:hypothetical protein n=1 Tax=Nocardia canadensis TaxID=3065238 RepID=UPI0029301171|nr:hypothetical protein [Nocardia canadensis]